MRDLDPGLTGKRLLVLDDEPMLAFQMAELLEDQGADVVGPANSVSEALDLIDHDGTTIDGAVLDIQIGNDMVWPVAERLARRGTPFLFVSGYRPSHGLPKAFADRICLPKPFNRALLQSRLAAIFPRRAAA